MITRVVVEMHPQAFCIRGLLFRPRHEYWITDRSIRMEEPPSTRARIRRFTQSPFCLLPQPLPSSLYLSPGVLLPPEKGRRTSFLRYASKNRQTLYMQDWNERMYTHLNNKLRYRLLLALFPSLSALFQREEDEQTRERRGGKRTRVSCLE